MPPAASLLAALLAVAFVLQLLTVISTPIVQSITIASNRAIQYGVFGFCQGSTCTKVGIGYQTQDDSNFNLSGASTRHALASILVVHPVAAFFTLVVLICSIAAHFHAPSHSSRFLLATIILMLPTFLLSLLAFLVDILLFIPHLTWGGWIMLAATIIIAVCGVLMCAMRRTLVSRKTRKNRVAENAEMSGENYYARQNAPRAASPPPLSQPPTAPMVTGSPGADKLPTFTTFESSKSRISGEDDRMPLNSNDRTGTDMSSIPGGRQSMDGMERYGGGRGGMMTQGRGGRGYGGPPRDQYGNPTSPPNYYGPGPGGRGSPMGYGPGYSTDTLSSGASRGRGGRGGYPPRGVPYGRGGPYGGRGRGGPPMGAMAAGAGAGMMAGEMMAAGHPRRRSDPRDANYGPGGPPSGPYGVSSYGGPNGPPNRHPSDPRYNNGRNPSPGPPSAPYGAAYANAAAASTHNSLPRAESPPPLPDQSAPQPEFDHHAIGQAIEMDEKTGSPAPTPGLVPPPLRQLSDHDSDVDGMVGLQQHRARNGEQPVSPSSAYSSQRTDSYATQRPWTAPDRKNTPPMPAAASEISRPGSARRSPPIVTSNAVTSQPQRARMSGDHYYEDVDARFADPSPQTAMPGSYSPPPLTTGIPVPDTLMAGRDQPPMPQGRQMGYGQQRPYQEDQQRPYLDQQPSYESEPSSENSNFTSISQRGVNPEWRPEEGYRGYGYEGGYREPYGHGGVPNRRPQQQQQSQQQRDFLLSTNPDFELRGAGGGRGRGR